MGMLCFSTATRRLPAAVSLSFVAVLLLLLEGPTHTAAFAIRLDGRSGPTLRPILTRQHVSTTDGVENPSRGAKAAANSAAPAPIKKRKPTKKNKPRSKVQNKHLASAASSRQGDSRLTTSGSSPKEIFATPRKTPPPPPLLADYATNCGANREVQEQRLWDDAIDATCVHYDTCAGCTVGRNVANTPVVQAAQRYFAQERYDGTSTSVIDDLASYPVIIPSPTTQWRTQAKLAVANKATSAWKRDGCIFGLYEKGTHKLQSIPNCVVHHPAINAAVVQLEQATLAAGTTAYREDAREGDLRYVQLQVERVTGQVCLTLVWNAATLKECQPSLARLVKALTKSTDTSMTAGPTLWHSIWCHCNDGVNNNIFSRSSGRWHRLSGPEFLREPLPVETAAVADDLQGSLPVAAGWLYFSPLNFRQGNLDGFEILALDVARAVPPKSKVCELYGGVGVLGLTALAHHYRHDTPLAWLRCSDENPANARCFYRAVESLRPVEMISGSGENAAEQKKRRDTSWRSKSSSKHNNGSSSEGLTLGELAAMMESGETFNSAPGSSSSRSSTSSTPFKKASYMVASAAKALKAGQALGAQVLIVDPPRRGLQDEVLDELCKAYDPNQPYVESATLLTVPDERVNWANDVQTLIYVSCGFDALASDCDRLLSSRGAKWTLLSTRGYILFPGSDHVETVAIFQRR